MAGSMLLPLLGMATDIMGGAIQAGTAGKMNRATRSHQIEMYERSVNVNRENWRMANEYNSPQQQMQRLRDAGLNPNLVYGDGATATGDTIQQSAPQQWNPENPGKGALPPGLIMGMYQMQQMAAQTNLTKEKIESENLNQRLTTVTTTLRELQAEYDRSRNDVQKATIQTQIDTANATLTNILQEIKLKSAHTENVTIGSSKMKQDMDIAIGDAILRWQKGDLELTKLGQEIRNIEADTRKKGAELSLVGAQTETQRWDAKLKELDTLMRANGISPTDSFVTQTLKSIFTPGVRGAAELWNKLLNYVRQHGSKTRERMKN